MSALWHIVLLAPVIEALLLSKANSLGFGLTFVLLLPFHIVLASIWKILLWPYVFSPLRKLPEPKGASWLHGHRHLVSDLRSGSPQNEWINQVPNDGLIRYRLKYNSELLMITSSKALSEVLVQKSYDFAKPRSLRLGLGRILGVGLIVAEGNEHKVQRRRLLPAFAHRHIKDLYSVLWTKAVELRLALTNQIEADAGGSEVKSAVVDLPPWVARTTLDIIGQAGMGEDFHAIENPNNEVCKAYASVFETPPPKSKLVILKYLLEKLVSRVFPVTRTDNIEAASNALKQVGRRLIDAKQKSKTSSGKLQDKDIVSVALESGAFTDENLVNQILTFLAAGHETTATSISWAIVALTQYPEIQEKLRKEVQNLLPQFTKLADGSANADVVDSLPYLHAVCNEVLRIYPPAGLTKRIAAKNTSIQGQFVPKGTAIMICMRAINHSTEHWGPDAAVFNPERWLGPGNFNSGGGADNFAFMTFLHGPRSCIGQGFARAEFAILLAVLVASFKIEMDDPSAPVQPVTGLTTRPKRLKVRMTPL